MLLYRSKLNAQLNTCAVPRRVSVFKLFPIVFVVCLAASGCTIHVVARQPQLNLLTNQRHVGSFAVDLSTVPKGEICYEGRGKGLCAAALHQSLDAGLHEVLSSRIESSASGPQYRASFRLEKFDATAIGDGASSVVRLIWQFELVDSEGKRVVALARTTVGDAMYSAGDAELGVQSALTATLEEIAKALDEGRW